MEQCRLEMNTFWYHEKELRLRTAGFTSNELRQLQGINNNLASQLSCEPQGYVLADCWSQQMLLDGARFEPGEVVMIHEALFPILKARYLSSYRIHSPALPSSNFCYCLPQAAFMPEGCQHMPRQPFKACPKCKICLRCGHVCKRTLRPSSRCRSCTCLPAGLDLHSLWKH